MTEDRSGVAMAAALTEAEALLDRAGVEGVGQGATEEGAHCILVLTAGPVDAGSLPDTIGGYPVRVLDIGEAPSAQDHDAVEEVAMDPDDLGDVR